MANQLHIYYGNISKEGTDGTEASAGTGLSPISVTLDAAKEESKVIMCAVRCDEGYHIEGNTTLKLVGANAAKWKLAPDGDFGSPEDADANGAWEESITLEHVGSLNAAFWVKAMSSKDEKPSNDTSVSLQAEGLVAADEGV